MAAYLNQIFYKSNKFDTPEKIKLLNNYILTNDFVKKIKKNENNQTIPLKNLNYKHNEFSNNLQVTDFCDNSNLHMCEKEPTTQKSQIYYPEQINSLFWCMYISKYSIGEYLHNKTPKNMIELEEKQKIINYVKTNSQKLKLDSNHKITNIMIQEIISDVMSLSKISMLSILGYAFFYQKNFFIVNGKTYYAFLYCKDGELENNNSAVITYNTETGNFRIDMSENILDKISEIKTNLLCLEGVDKPLKGVSTYKVSELEDIARKLDFKSEVALNKKDLHDKLYELCIWNLNDPIIRKKHKHINK